MPRLFEGVASYSYITTVIYILATWYKKVFEGVASHSYITADIYILAASYILCKTFYTIFERDQS